MILREELVGSHGRWNALAFKLASSFFLTKELWVAQELTEQLEGLHKGVYFGWAKLQGEEDAGPGHMMVMNVGDRPTFVDGAGLSVEVHVMHDYDRDFHGACPQWPDTPSTQLPQVTGLSTHWASRPGVPHGGGNALPSNDPPPMRPGDAIPVEYDRC
jgi:hypothetical protein